METISCADASRSLEALVERIVCEGEPIVIRRENLAVVMIPLNEYCSMRETLHLMGTVANARRLLESIDQLESGKVVNQHCVAREVGLDGKW